MRSILFALASTLIVTGSVARAADIAEVVYADKSLEKRWNWTGAQVGVQAGYGWVKDRTNAPDPAMCFPGPEVCAASGDDDVYGFFAGYNHQMGNFVVGAELSYTHHASGFNDISTVAMHDTTVIAARAGYAIDRVLAYGFLGGVYGRTTADALPSPPFAPNMAVEDWSGSDWGLAYGVGIDVAVTEKIFVGLRYERQEYKDFNDLGIDAWSNSGTMRVGFKF